MELYGVSRIGGKLEHLRLQVGPKWAIDAPSAVGVPMEYAAAIYVMSACRVRQLLEKGAIPEVDTQRAYLVTPLTYQSTKPDVACVAVANIGLAANQCKRIMSTLKVDNDRPEID